VAHDPATGQILWYQRLTRPVSNGPSTWTLDGVQYLVVGAGDTLYAFTLPRQPARP
jgi:alcohol dehydrogenase (cytochrome c)